MALIYLGGLFCYIDIPQYIRKKEIYGAAPSRCASSRSSSMKSADSCRFLMT